MIIIFIQLHDKYTCHGVITYCNENCAHAATRTNILNSNATKLFKNFKINSAINSRTIEGWTFIEKRSQFCKAPVSLPSVTRALELDEYLVNRAHLKRLHN